MGHAEESDLELILLETAQEEMVRRGKIAEGIIAAERPELIDLFLTYQNEAVAARRFLDNNLNELIAGAEILEVGGGILALATQLASEGFIVTTVEPVGEGFTGISFMMKVFSEIAILEKLNINLIKSPIEESEFNHKFDFIFSINVMEHLKNPYVVLKQMVDALKPAGKYRFFCPNYGFPYEPHFGKWLLLRRNKAFFLQESRINSSIVSKVEALGLYRSINFITFKQVQNFSKINSLTMNANNDAFYNLISRAILDQELRKRHRGPAIFIKLMTVMKFQFLAKLIPKCYQPVMDIEASASGI